MKGFRFGSALLMLVVAASAVAQTGTSAPEKPARLDLSVNYVADIANAGPGVCGCFAMSGGGTEVAYYLRPDTAVVADISVVHTNLVSGTNNGLGLATYMAGARHAFRNKSRFLPYVQVEVGGVHGFDSLFPAPGAVTGATSANSAALDFGTGLQIKYNRRISIRALEVDYLQTWLPNNARNTEHNMKIAAGVVFHFR